MTSNERLSPDGVQATLNYTLPDSTGESLYTYHICPPPQMPRTNPKPDPRSVVISNVRDREDEFSLDTCGFEFFKYPRTVKEFFDEEVIRTRYHPEVKEFFDEVIRTRYYPEVKELLKTHTGGKRVIIIGHAIRRGRGDDAKIDQVDVQGPAAWLINSLCNNNFFSHMTVFLSTRSTPIEHLNLQLHKYERLVGTAHNALKVASVLSMSGDPLAQQYITSR